MADESKKMKCPSCGFAMIGGKYCPVCRAELVDENIMQLGLDFEDRVAKKTAALVLEELRKGGDDAEKIPQEKRRLFGK